MRVACAFSIAILMSLSLANHARAMGDPYAPGVSSISMWWLDVEIINKWSLQLNLNRFALQGTVTRLSQTDLPVGIYSSPAMWLTITGVMAMPGYLSAIWYAGGSCSRPF